jgi:cyclase
MLAKRIIPALDIKDGKVSKGVNFNNVKYAGDPEELAELYNKEGADEIVFLDINASHESRDIIIDIVEKVARKVMIPLTVGGGVRTIDDFRKILKSGADKVFVNTAAIKNPQLIKQAAELFGSQCVVVAIDAKRFCADRTGDSDSKNVYNVYMNGGRIDTGKNAVEWAQEVQHLGAGEILLTSMDADGTKNGYDVSLTREVSKIVKIPVIASGGAGKLEHFSEVIKEGYADAVLAASLFHFKELGIGQVKEFLNKNGIEVRL